MNHRKKILLFLALAAAPLAPAQTPASRAALYAEIDAFFADTGSSEITPAQLRQSLKNLAASAQNPLTDGTAVTTSGSFIDPAWLTLSKAKVGLANVDNTADAAKPVSTAQAAADVAVASAAATDATTKANAAQAFAAQRGNHTGTQALSSLAQSGATTNQVPQWNGTAWVPATIAGGGGAGTVTSVGLALPSIFSVSGSPITGSGTLTGALATQTANLVFAGPASGAAAAPTFRVLTYSDVPSVLGLFNTGSDQITGEIEFVVPPAFASGTLTGIVKSPGDGSPLLAATAGTDYVVPSGNVATATALATARTIGGASFNGTADVTSFPSPGPIGATTADTGKFTSLTVDNITPRPFLDVSPRLRIWTGSNGNNRNLYLGGSASGALNGSSGTNPQSNTVIGTVGAGTSFGPGIAITTGSYNTIVGSESGSQISTGGYNALFGYQAGKIVTGSFNTALGTYAGSALTTGQYNHLDGFVAGSGRTTGDSNTDVGAYAGPLATSTGSGNVNLGFSAGRYATGSNEFYLNNQDRSDTSGDQTKSLLYGTFNATETSQTLRVNGVVFAFGNALTNTSGLLVPGAIGSGTALQVVRRNAGNTALEFATVSTGGGDLLASNNLSDLVSASAARTNLGLGTLATQSGTFSGTSSGTNTGDQTTITGNAGTATALQNTRTIGGSSFNGTANVTSFPAPGAIGGTTPATGAFTTLTSSGATTSSAGFVSVSNGAMALQAVAATTAQSSIQLGNGGGSLHVGVNDSLNSYYPSSAANASVFYSAGNNSYFVTPTGTFSGNLQVNGVLSAGSAPTTLTNSAGLIVPGAIGSGSALQAVRRNAANTALEYFTISAGGGDVTQAGDNVFTGFNYYGGQFYGLVYPMAALAVDMSKSGNSYTATGNVTFTYANAPVPQSGQNTILRITADSTARTITIPSTYSLTRGGNITSLLVPASTTLHVKIQYLSGRWEILGDPADTTGSGPYVLGTAPTLTLPNATGLPLTTGVTGLLPVANGGTGTASPGAIAGSGIAITGTWPTQTISTSGATGETWLNRPKVTRTLIANGTNVTSIGSGNTVSGTGSSIAAAATSTAGARYASAATTNSDAGWNGNGNYTHSGLNPRMVTTFSLASYALGVQRAMVGLTTNTTSSMTDDPGAVSVALFRYSTSASDTNWQCISNDGVTGSTITDSGVAASAAWVTLAVETSASNVKFYINGTLVATHTTNLPATAVVGLTHSVRVRTLENVAKNIDVVRVSVEEP